MAPIARGPAFRDTTTYGRLVGGSIMLLLSPQPTETQALLAHSSAAPEIDLP